MLHHYYSLSLFFSLQLCFSYNQPCVLWLADPCFLEVLAKYPTLLYWFWDFTVGIFILNLQRQASRFMNAAYNSLFFPKIFSTAIAMAKLRSMHPLLDLYPPCSSCILPSVTWTNLQAKTLPYTIPITLSKLVPITTALIPISLPFVLGKSYGLHPILWHYPFPG